MDIKILGAGCPKCHQLAKVTREVVKELAIDINVEEVKDLKKIMQYSILTTPGLVINGELVCSGRVPSKSEMTKFIKNIADKDVKPK